MSILTAGLNQEITINKTLSRVIGIAVFALATSLGAFVRIPLPFTPVPLTLQTFFVLLAGLSLGSRDGALSQLVYLVIGFLGFSVFTGAGSGPQYLFGPTGGYLLGFVLAAFLSGKLVRAASGNAFLIFSFLVLADFLLLACGTAWLGLWSGSSPSRLFFIGFLPFVPGDLLKISAVTAVYARFQKRLDKIF